MNLWPSSQFRSIAYEIKVSRSDFMREMKDPSKRAHAENHAGECFFVAPNGLVRVDEVPEGWGLLECTSGGLRQVKAATQRKIAPWPLSFMASIARRSAEPVTRVEPALWKYAGEEITAEQLLKMAIEAQGEDMRAKLLLQDADRQDLVRLRNLQHYLTQRFGYQATESVERLRSALDAQTGPYLPTEDIDLVRRAVLLLNKALEKRIPPVTPPTGNRQEWT